MQSCFEASTVYSQSASGMLQLRRTPGCFDRENDAVLYCIVLLAVFAAWYNSFCNSRFPDHQLLPCPAKRDIKAAASPDALKKDTQVTDVPSPDRYHFLCACSHSVSQSHPISKTRHANSCCSKMPCDSLCLVSIYCTVLHTAV